MSSRVNGNTEGETGLMNVANKNGEEAQGV